MGISGIHNSPSSWSNPLPPDSFSANDLHSQHGPESSCPFCNASPTFHIGNGQTFHEQVAGAAVLAGAVQQSGTLSPDVVALRHRPVQDAHAPTDPVPFLGLNNGYGPDARPVPAGVFDEQGRNDHFSRERKPLAGDLKNHPADEAEATDAPGQEVLPKQKGQLEQVVQADQTDLADRVDQADQRDDNLPNLDESELSLEERRILDQLRQRDAEVRAHEQAHIAAGGQYVSGGASYSYQTGPDGRQYAVGGEVSIDTSPVPGNPEQTEQKAQAIRRAALAPATPSPQDVKVAASASQMEAEARMEKLQAEEEETQQATARSQDSSQNLVPSQDTASPRIQDQRPNLPPTLEPFSFAPESTPWTSSPGTRRSSFIQAYQTTVSAAGTWSVTA